jgi:hypothetical protein
VPDTESKTSSVRIVLKDMRSVLRVTRRVTANSSRSRSRSTTGRICTAARISASEKTGVLAEASRLRISNSMLLRLLTSASLLPYFIMSFTFLKMDSLH